MEEAAVLFEDQEILLLSVPLEVTHLVLHFLNLEDFLRLRLVCWKFYWFTRGLNRLPLASQVDYRILDLFPNLDTRSCLLTHRCGIPGDRERPLTLELELLSLCERVKGPLFLRLRQGWDNTSILGIATEVLRRRYQLYPDMCTFITVDIVARGAKWEKYIRERGKNQGRIEEVHQRRVEEILRYTERNSLRVPVVSDKFCLGWFPEWKPGLITNSWYDRSVAYNESCRKFLVLRPALCTRELNVRKYGPHLDGYDRKLSTLLSEIPFQSLYLDVRPACLNKIYYTDIGLEFMTSRFPGTMKTLATLSRPVEFRCPRDRKEELSHIPAGISSLYIAPRTTLYDILHDWHKIETFLLRDHPRLTIIGLMVPIKKVGLLRLHPQITSIGLVFCPSTVTRETRNSTFHPVPYHELLEEEQRTLRSLSGLIDTKSPRLPSHITTITYYVHRTQRDDDKP